MPTLKTLIAKNPEVSKMVYDKYPTTKMERRGCEREKARLDYLRWVYAEKLVMEKPQSEKAEYK